MIRKDLSEKGVYYPVIYIKEDMLANQTSSETDDS